MRREDEEREQGERSEREEVERGREEMMRKDDDKNVKRRTRNSHRDRKSEKEIQRYSNTETKADT